MGDKVTLDPSIVQHWDGSITTDTNFTYSYALTPKNESETEAEYRARTARELWANGDKWTAYKVLQNSRDVSYFFVSAELMGAYGDIDRTAEIVQARYENMRRLQERRMEIQRLEVEQRERISQFLKTLRKVLTFGLWR